MSKSIYFWLVILLLWLVIGSFLFCKYICGIGGVAAAPAAAAATAAIPADKCSSAWTLKDGNTFRASSKDHFQFVRSSYANLTPSVAATNAMNKTVDYLKKNKDRGVTITGYYDNNEKNGSVLNNLGEARANTIKNLLTAKGVPANQLSIKGAVMKDACWTSDRRTNRKGTNAAKNNGAKNNASVGIDTLRRGATFAFSDVVDNKDRIAGIKNRLFGKPVTLYFQTNSDNINLNGQQRTDLTDLIYYLGNVPGSKLNISGHTDNIGNLQSNITLSEGRANDAMNYLKSKGGIAVNRMNVQGFGPNRPVADNNTDAGRAKNRRVEVTLN